MSWMKCVSSEGGDVFDEDADELNVQNNEWTSNMKRRIRDGYVDGVDAGEEASLQVGFNLGYHEGAARTVAVGRLKGIVSAIWCRYHIHHPENPIPASVTDLLQQVTHFEDTTLDDMRKVLENPPPSVSDISESMEDLQVHQGDSGCCGEVCREDNCCKKREEMDLDAHQPQRLCSGSTDCSSTSAASLHHLLQRSMDVVLELGLPQELIGHIQELKDM
ncbi:OTU deubiquitinase with linear linkage specificity a [Thalassophryne amazonica]|uniref:OTU deubiquitinase with linear linkage specificity a n=1 Tax=Thalassophryne amazonica TaxID=390379 RepID=UPI001470E693|nr:OTU deubiquitinase with linear linkage specificity a [Thalassophryne amazonica]